MFGRSLKQCSVPGCSGYREAAESGVTHNHRFPRDNGLCEQWLVNIRNKDLPTNMTSEQVQQYRVCGKHFIESDYKDDIQHRMAPHIYKPTYILKETAVPSVFSFTQPAPSNVREAYEKRENMRAEISQACNSTVLDKMMKARVARKLIAGSSSKPSSKYRFPSTSTAARIMRTCILDRSINPRTGADSNREKKRWVRGMGTKGKAPGKAGYRRSCVTDVHSPVPERGMEVSNNEDTRNNIITMVAPGVSATCFEPEDAQVTIKQEPLDVSVPDGDGGYKDATGSETGSTLRIYSTQSLCMNQDEYPDDIVDAVTKDTIKSKLSDHNGYEESYRPINKNGISKKAATAKDVMSLDLIREMETKDFVDTFAEKVVKVTFKCQMVPGECSQSYSSSGNENKARQLMKRHIAIHVAALVQANDSNIYKKIDFTAEPIAARKRRLKAVKATQKSIQGKYNSSKSNDHSNDPSNDANTQQKLRTKRAKQKKPKPMAKSMEYKPADETSNNVANFRNSKPQSRVEHSPIRSKVKRSQRATRQTELDYEAIFDSLKKTNEKKPRLLHDGTSLIVDRPCPPMPRASHSVQTIDGDITTIPRMSTILKKSQQPDGKRREPPIILRRNRKPPVWMDDTV